MRFKLTGRLMQIIVTNEEIVYDWITDEINPPNKSIKPLRKKGYVTKDLSGREIGITYMADAKYKGMSYMLFFKEYEQEFGVYRLVKTIFDKTFPFSELKDRLETQDIYDELQIKI